MIEIFYKHTLSKNDVVFYLKSNYFKYENRTYLKYIGSTKKFETNSEEDQVVFHKMFKEISQTHFEDDHIVFHKIFKEIKDFELTLRLYITAINAKYKESFFVKVINSPASHIMCAKENKIDSFKLVVWKMKVKNNNILGIDLDKNIFEELGNIIGNDNPILLESKNISLSKSMLRNIEDFTIDKLCNIENTIDLILEKTKQNKTLKSTNLKEICNYFGIFLERKSLKSEIIVKENRYIINYKKNTDENKERFDISYQLGNLFLYVLKGINLEKIHKESNIYEKEANIFAGKLLFPKYIINKINKDYKGKKLSKLNLSKRFEIETNDFYNILQNYNVWDIWIKNETIINDSKKV